jgi:IS5 family transposase
LAEVNRRLDGRGLILGSSPRTKRGALVEATIIAAAVKRPAFEDGQVDPGDPDASFTVKNGETFFGYEAHLAVDEESGIVRQAQTTSADPHDSRRGEAPIRGDERAYDGDKAYDSRGLRDRLAERGIEDRIAYQAERGKEPANWRIWFDKTASSVRVGVERANATMKNWRGMAGVRRRGPARNHCRLRFVAMAMNMKRARVLLAAA